MTPDVWRTVEQTAGLLVLIADWHAGLITPAALRRTEYAYHAGRGISETHAVVGSLPPVYDQFVGTG